MKDIKVTFLDHTQGNAGPIEFTVHGLLVEEALDYIVIQSWHYSDDFEVSKDSDQNIVQFTILKSTIQDIKYCSQYRKYKYVNI